MENIVADYLLADFGSFVEKCAAAGVDAYDFVEKVAQFAQSAAEDEQESKPKRSMGGGALRGMGGMAGGALRGMAGGAVGGGLGGSIAGAGLGLAASRQKSKVTGRAMELAETLKAMLEGAKIGGGIGAGVGALGGGVVGGASR